jgi:hypothetical protein
MTLWLVTVKLPRNPQHDPLNKVTGECPANQGNAVCTDVTGQHHTILAHGDSLNHVKSLPYLKKYHVTRIEEV